MPCGGSPPSSKLRGARAPWAAGLRWLALSALAPPPALTALQLPALARSPRPHTPGRAPREALLKRRLDLLPAMPALIHFPSWPGFC